MDKIKSKFIEKKSILGNTIAFIIEYKGLKYGQYLKYDRIENKYRKMRILATIKKDLIKNLRIIDYDKKRSTNKKLEYIYVQRNG